MTDESGVGLDRTFGLAALELALLAKDGRVARGQALQLSGLARAILPDDADARRACAHFAVMLPAGQPAAGAWLHEWILVRCGVGTRAPATHISWQDRADLR